MIYSTMVFMMIFLSSGVYMTNFYIDYLRYMLYPPRDKI